MKGVIGDGERLAISSWDYSWLTRRGGRCREYRGLEKVLDELVERGFNALRVDAFPHLVAAQPGGTVLEHFEVLPEPLDPGRGSTELVDVFPRRDLVELLRMARDRDVRVLLTSWFTPDLRATRSFIRGPEDYVRVWTETLHFLRQRGVLDAVVAVDICNEFPHGLWAPGAYRRAFHAHPANPLPLYRTWPPTAERCLEAYITEVPRALRTLFPDIRFGVSTTALIERNLRALDTTELDFLDAHVWLADDPVFTLSSGALLGRAPSNPLLAAQRRLAERIYKRRPERWRRILEERLTSLSGFAARRRHGLMVSEGYVAAGPRASRDPRWLQQVSEAALTSALALPVDGLCVSECARPHDPELWDQVDWLQRMTARIRAVR